MDFFFSLSFNFYFSHLASNKYMFKLPLDVTDGYIIYNHYVILTTHSLPSFSVNIILFLRNTCYIFHWITDKGRRFILITC